MTIRSDYWKCPDCGHMTHFSSDACEYPACLAKYWRRQAERYHDSAQKCIDTAEELEKQAQEREAKSQ